MGIWNNPEEVHGRNLVFPDLWSGSSHTNESKLVQCSGFRIQPCREFRVDAKIVESVRRIMGINYYTTGRISAKTCPEIQQRREEKGVWSGRLGTLESGREYMGYQRRKASANLGGTI